MISLIIIYEYKYKNYIMVIPTGLAHTHAYKLHTFHLLQEFLKIRKQIKNS